MSQPGIRRAGAVIAVVACALLAGCTLPPGEGTPAQSGGIAREANDPVARSFVSDEDVRQGHDLFRRIMAAEGMLGVRTAIRKCERPDPRPDPRTPNLPAGLCMALDRSQVILGVSFERQQGVRMLEGLRPADVDRREANYLRVLRVPPDQHRLVKDSVFQRVFTLSTATR